MRLLFQQSTKEEFFESVDRAIAQLDAGQGQDAFEALDEVTSELEAGYKAMRETEFIHSQREETSA